MDKRAFNKKYVLLVIAVVITIAVIAFFKLPVKTVMVEYGQYEQKISFKGFYFVDESIVYRGETKGLNLNFKNGDIVPKDAAIANGIISTDAGMLITHLDGYENMYNLNNVKGITAKEINNMVENNNRISGIKIVNNSEWFICAVIDNENGKYFNKYASKDLLINSKYYPAVIVDKFQKDDGTYLILSIKDDLDITDSNRGFSGYIIRDRYNGISVPSKAVADFGGDTGVYIDFNGYAEFKKVQVLFQDGGNYIITPLNPADIGDYDEIITNAGHIRQGDKIN